MSRTLSLLGLVLIMSMSTCHEVKIEEGVLVGNKENFDEIISSNKHVLAEFYAPWCGHCKSLAPEYAKAAQQLASEGSLIKLVKVDATENQELGTRFGVQGYPTLKFFIDGKDHEYKGGRTQSEIVSWLMKKTGPAVQQVGQDKLNSLKNSEKVFYVQVGDIKTETEQLANQLEDLTVVAIESLEGYNAGDFIAFRKFDEPQVKCEECSTVSDMQSFVDQTRVARVMEFDQDAAQYIFGGQKSSLILFIEEGVHDVYMQMLNEASDRVRADGLIVSFSQIRKDIGQRLGDYLGIKAADLPCVHLVDFSQGEDLSKFVMQKEVTVENIVEFSQQWKNKELKRTYKSAEVPEQSHDGSVRVLVGKNFKEEVYQVPNRFTFVEFYAPWCGHCKKLVPEYEALAARIKGFENLVIAKVDSTENEVEGVSVQGFPTLKLFAPENSQIIDYDAGRTASSMEGWLADRVPGLKEYLEGLATEEVKEEVVEKREDL